MRAIVNSVLPRSEVNAWKSFISGYAWRRPGGARRKGEQMVVSRFVPAITAALTVLVAVEISSAAPIKVLVLDHEAGTDAGFGAGGRYEAAYNSMLNPMNFGASGKVNHTFQFLTPVSSLNNISLSDVGLVIVAHSHLKSTTFSDGSKIFDHVYNHGGSVLALGHSFSDIESSSHANLGRWLTRVNNDPNTGYVPNGFGSSTPYRRPSGNTVVQAVGDGPVNGSFGDIQGTLVQSTANEYWTGVVGAGNGTYALEYQYDNFKIGRDGLYGQAGAGRFMLVGGVNTFGSGTSDAGTEASQFGGSNSNEAFFLNSIEYLAGSTITAVPEPSTLMSLAAATAMIARRQRKRRSH